MCRKRRKKDSSHFQSHFFTKDTASKTGRANVFLRFVMSRKAQDMSKKKVAYSSRTGDPT